MFSFIFGVIVGSLATLEAVCIVLIIRHDREK